MGKGWVIGILVVLLLGGVGAYLLQKNTATPSPSSTQQTTQSASRTVTTTQSQNTITLTETGYSPAALTIKAGQLVKWVNNSGSAATVNSDPHPTHTNYPPLNLGEFSSGGTLNLTFTTPGTYGYHNHFNPSQHGTIIVQ